ncbi:MAG: acyl-CoA dehydrogenase, partial [Betaproteobacteria bacterium]
VLAARLLEAGETGASAEMLARLIQGSLLPAVAWQESHGDIDAARVATEVVPARTASALCGTKQCVAFGCDADGYLVSARSAAGVGIYWVARGSSGLTYRSMRRADGSEHGTLVLDRVPVRAEHCVLAPGTGDKVLAGAIDEAIIVSSAELLGLAERALEITLEFLRARVQFGAAIGSFQALQHRCVDLFIHKELGVSALTAALSEWDRADCVRRSVLASRVKARCADAALDICRKSIQMHGAMGFTDDCDIGLYLKRGLVLAAWLGNAQLHRRRYARLALADAASAPGTQGRAA